MLNNEWQKEKKSSQIIYGNIAGSWDSPRRR
jgi:hypothetical protein